MAKWFAALFSTLKSNVPKFRKVLVKYWKEMLVVFVIFITLVYFLGFLFTFLLISLLLLYLLYNLCDILLYNPQIPQGSRVMVKTPNIAHEVFYIYTIDNVKIYVQLIKQSVEPQSAVTVIYLHGNAGNVGHRLDNAMEMYNLLKCNILMVEYRGYGLSSGTPSEAGLYKDALAAIQFLHRRDDICHTKIVLFGRSLGGAVAIGICDQILRTYRYANFQPMAMIIENTFTSLPRISRHLCKNNGTWLRMITMVPDWFYKSRFDSLNKISNNALPTLFVSGQADEIIPREMMSELFRNSGACFKELHNFEGGSHNFTWKSAGYYNMIDSFLQKVSTIDPPDGMKMSSVSVLKGERHQDNEKLPLIACEQATACPEDSDATPAQVFLHPENVQFSFALHPDAIDLVTI